MSKLIVIVGITGTQGSSVARVFLKDPTYKIRGITRDASKPESQALIKQGIEIVQGDIDDVSTLIKAFKGASVIFGNTVFPGTFFAPSDEVLASLKPGQTLREWCYEKEFRQGKNIADAVATVGGSLDLFVWSSLSNARKWSKGIYRGVFHFDSKAAVVDYIKEKHPEVARKTSELQLGFFVTNWRAGQIAVPWEKRADGSLRLRIPGTGNVPAPFLDPADTGYFVQALTQVPAGKKLLAFADRLTWTEYVQLWSKVTGVPAAFEHSAVADLDRLAPGGVGEEMGEMHAYAQDFGYDGGDPDIIYPKDLGVDLGAVTRIEDYFKNQDWSPLLG